MRKSKRKIIKYEFNSKHFSKNALVLLIGILLVSTFTAPVVNSFQYDGIAANNADERQDSAVKSDRAIATYNISESNSNKAYHTGDGWTPGEVEDIGENTPLPPGDDQYSEHDSIEYSNVEMDDGSKNEWASYDFEDDDLPEYNWINLWYNFTINEVLSSIVAFQVLWNGYDELDDGGDFEFDIWNYSSSSWEIVNQTTSGEILDQVYVKTFTSNISNYISDMGYLHLGISGERTLNSGSRQTPCTDNPHHTLYEDYVEVKITTGNVDDPSWWSVHWEYRKLITIDHTKVDGDLSNFPMLVSLYPDNNLSNHAQEDGDDIAFILYSDNSTQLNHEIESYDGEGNLTAWVNIPYLSSSVDTNIWMYYGNPPCDSQENVTGTWNDNYAMVQHLQEISGVHYDSTQYENNGTQLGSVDQNATGMINGADEFDGVDDCVNVNDNDSLDITDAITVEAWISSNVTETTLPVLVKDYDGSSVPYRMDIGSSSPINGFGFYDGTWRTTSLSGNEVDGEWHYLVGTYDGSTLRYYVDGSLIDTVAYSATLPTNDAPLYLGRYQTYYFNGSIDESRVSNSVRNVSWINTSYLNQLNLSVFYDLGEEDDINLLPVADFVYAPDNPSTADIVYFDSTSFDSDGDIVNFTWDFGDTTGTYGGHVSHQYSDNNTYTVRLTIRDNDGATDYKEHTVNVSNEPPVAGFTYNPPEPSTSDIVYFNSTSYDSDGIIVNWTWSLGDGNYSYTENMTHQYNANGSYTVNLTIRDDDNATSYDEQFVYVGNEHPIANFTFVPALPSTFDLVCFNSTSYDIDGYIVNWTWNFGDGNISYGENVTHQYSMNDSYTVSLTVCDDDNATDFNEQFVYVGNQLPIANFTFEPALPSTSDIVYFNSTSYDSDGILVNWTWDLGDGNYSYTENTTHQYNANGSYTVRLTVRDNSSETNYTEQFVYVGNTHPIANFTIEPIFSSVLDIVYFNSTSYDIDGYIVNWTWNFGDGNISYGENVTHQYSMNDSYIVRLTVCDDDNATDFTEKIVYVGNQLPVANFTIEPHSPTVSDLVYFNSTSYDIDGYIVNWTWNLGDGNYSFGQNIVHQYEYKGPYAVTLEIIDDGGETVNVSKNVQIGGVHIANLSSGWNFVSVPFNQSIDTTNTTINCNGTEYNWTEAIISGVVSQYIFGWNRVGGGYTFEDALEPGYGYWMYVYYDCEFLALGVNTNPDTYITDIESGWNIVGVPDDQNVGKTDFVIYYNGTEYNWTEAIISGVVNQYIFGWNSAGGGYIFADILEPGCGYWMYAYYSCIILRSEI